MHGVTIYLDTQECVNCGVPFGITSQLLGQLKETGKSFYCPNGHSMVFSKPKSEQVRDELIPKIEQQQRTIASLERQLSELKRPQNECPHCGKKYKGLCSHIRRMHPEKFKS